jgi:hypothetical protein
MSAVTLQILEKASELPVLELDGLIENLTSLRARKEQEAQLLQNIQAAVPPALRSRWLSLIQEQQTRPLTRDETAELTRLVDDVELREAKRAGYLSELARLRGIPLLELVAQLGLRPRDQDPL